MAGEMEPQDDYDWLFDARFAPRPVAEPPRTLTDTAVHPLLPVGNWRNDPEPESHALFRMTVVAGIVAAAVFGVMDRTGDASVHQPNGDTGRSQAACIARLPLTEKLGQKLMLGATANTLAADMGPFARHHIGGVVLMDEVPAAETQAFNAKQSIQPLVATDQEGGAVQRYKHEGALPSPQAMAARYLPGEAEQIIEKDDTYLHAQGVNMNLAPLADVAEPSGGSVLGSRVFSSDPKTVALYARVYVEAAQNAGVLPTLKHFPGLGSASGNTDYGPATAPASQRDLAPYASLAGTTAAVMVGNQIVPGLTTGAPASLSRAAVTTLLRGKLGYAHNVVVTDSLSAKAIIDTLSEADAVVRAWEAGADEALVVQTPAGQSEGRFVKDVIARAQSAIAEGALSVSEINDSVERLFALPQKGVDACMLSPNKK